MTNDQVKTRLGDDRDAWCLVEGGDLHAACLILEAKKRGIHAEVIERKKKTDERLSWNWLRLDFPDKVAYFRIGRILVGPPGSERRACVHVNGALRRVVDSKQASKNLIRVLGFSTPSGTFFRPDQEQEALAWFRALGKPACLKRDHGSLGTDVFPDLADEADFMRAFRIVSAGHPMIIAEEHAEGSAVRFFFVRPKVVAVRLDVPANVVGDGVSSIGQLIEAKNLEKRLRTGHEPIPVNDEVLLRLSRRGMNLDSVPARGEQLLLLSVSNGCKGSDAITLIDDIHPSYVQLIETMCNAIRGFNVTAVDTKIRDYSAPVTPENYRILEINSNPGLVPFHFPWEGKPQDVSSALLQMLSAL